MKIKFLLLSLLLSCSLQAEFEASLKSTEDSTPKKSVVTLTTKNSFSQPIKSARAWVFALDESGAVVGQKSAWIISKEQRARGERSCLPILDAGDTAEIKMAIDTERPAASTKVTFTKIVLADGSLVNPHKQVVPYKE
jgi:hypothetical protein